MKEIYETNNIHTTAIIYDGVSIGTGNTIGPYCIIGAPPEWKGKENISGCVIIGNNNTITGLATIDSGIDKDNPTIINNNCYLMKHVHLGHGVVLENNVTVSVGAILGGNAYLMEGVNFALNAVCHQYQTIGAYSMVGMGSIVTKKSKILPGEIHVGSPAKFIKINQVGLQRNNITPDKLEYLVKNYNKLSDENLIKYDTHTGVIRKNIR